MSSKKNVKKSSRISKRSRQVMNLNNFLKDKQEATNLTEVKPNDSQSADFTRAIPSDTLISSKGQNKSEPIGLVNANDFPVLGGAHARSTKIKNHALKNANPIPVAQDNVSRIVRGLGSPRNTVTDNLTRGSPPAQSMNDSLKVSTEKASTGVTTLHAGGNKKPIAKVNSTTPAKNIRGAVKTPNTAMISGPFTNEKASKQMQPMTQGTGLKNESAATHTQIGGQQKQTYAQHLQESKKTSSSTTVGAIQNSPKNAKKTNLKKEPAAVLISSKSTVPIAVANSAVLNKKSTSNQSRGPQERPNIQKGKQYNIIKKAGKATESSKLAKGTASSKEEQVSQPKPPSRQGIGINKKSSPKLTTIVPVVVVANPAHLDRKPTHDQSCCSDKSATSPKSSFVPVNQSGGDLNSFQSSLESSQNGAQAETHLINESEKEASVAQLESSLLLSTPEASQVQNMQIQESQACARQDASVPVGYPILTPDMPNDAMRFQLGQQNTTPEQFSIYSQHIGNQSNANAQGNEYSQTFQSPENLYTLNENGQFICLQDFEAINRNRNSFYQQDAPNEAAPSFLQMNSNPDVQMPAMIAPPIYPPYPMGNMDVRHMFVTPQPESQPELALQPESTAQPPKTNVTLSAHSEIAIPSQPRTKQRHLVVEELDVCTQTDMNRQTFRNRRRRLTKRWRRLGFEGCPPEGLDIKDLLSRHRQLQLETPSSVTHTLNQSAAEFIPGVPYHSLVSLRRRRQRHNRTLRSNTVLNLPDDSNKSVMPDMYQVDAINSASILQQLSHVSQNAAPGYIYCASQDLQPPNTSASTYVSVANQPPICVEPQNIGMQQAAGDHSSQIVQQLPHFSQNMTTGYTYSAPPYLQLPNTLEPSCNAHPIYTPPTYVAVTNPATLNNSNVSTVTATQVRSTICEQSQNSALGTGRSAAPHNYQQISQLNNIVDPSVFRLTSLPRKGEGTLPSTIGGLIIGTTGRDCPDQHIRDLMKERLSAKTTITAVHHIIMMCPRSYNQCLDLNMCSRALLNMHQSTMDQYQQLKDPAKMIFKKALAEKGNLAEGPIAAINSMPPSVLPRCNIFVSSRRLQRQLTVDLNTVPTSITKLYNLMYKKFSSYAFAYTFSAQIGQDGDRKESYVYFIIGPNNVHQLKTKEPSIRTYWQPEDATNAINVFKKCRVFGLPIYMENIKTHDKILFETILQQHGTETYEHNLVAFEKSNKDKSSFTNEALNILQNFCTHPYIHPHVISISAVVFTIKTFAVLKELWKPEALLSMRFIVLVFDYTSKQV